MSMNANIKHAIQCSPALAQAARNSVRSAAATKFPSEPLFDPALGRLLSTCTSVIKRHGPLVQAAIAETLRETGCEVWQNVKIPFTRTGMTFVASPDYGLNRRPLTFDGGDVAGHFDADVLAVDDAAGWACALQVRRGGGATEPVKRKRMEREMRALDLTLGSWLRQAGFVHLETSAVALVDWLGLAGFSEEITLHGADLDEFLDAPASKKIEAMNDVLRAELDGQTNNLLRSVLDVFQPPLDAATALDAPQINGMGKPDAVHQLLSTLRRPRAKREPNLNSPPPIHASRLTPRRVADRLN